VGFEVVKKRQGEEVLVMVQKKEERVVVVLVQKQEEPKELDLLLNMN